MRSQRWQHGLMLLSGAWLLCSPFLVPAYDAVGAAAVWSSHITGAAIFIVASIALVRPGPWQAWVGLTIGCWLIVAPLALGFSTISGVAASNHMLVGIVVGLNALALLALHGRGLQVNHADQH